MRWNVRVVWHVAEEDGHQLTESGSKRKGKRRQAVNIPFEGMS